MNDRTNKDKGFDSGGSSHSEPKVSIIVPAYNVERFISTCVESLLMQSYHNIEIVVVDDGSDDSTLQILQYLQSNDKRIKLIRGNHGGPNHARRQALKQATGDYIMFVDSDDLLSKDAVSILIREFAQNEGIDIIRFNGKSETTGQIVLPALKHGRRKNILNHDEAIALLLTTYTLNSLCFQIYKAKLLSADVFDCNVSSGEDFLANLAIHDRADKTLFISDVLYSYRDNPNSTTHRLASDRVVNNMLGRVYASLMAIRFAREKKLNCDLLSKIAYEQIKMTKWSIYRLTRLDKYGKDTFERDIKKAFSVDPDIIKMFTKDILEYTKSLNIRERMDNQSFVRSILTPNYKRIWWLGKVNNTITRMNSRVIKHNNGQGYIYKYMRGRLGNQLFQYATIRQIQEKNDTKDIIRIDFSKYVYSLGFKNDLVDFMIKPYEEVDTIRIPVYQKLIIVKYKIIKRLYRFVNPKGYKQFRYNLENSKADALQKKGIYWKEDGKIKINATNAKSKVVIGHFESSKNFDEIRPQLIKEIQPLYPPLAKNKKLYDIIKNSESVCISIRRGDFVENPEFAKNFNVCDERYFKNAVSEIKKLVDSPVFIIFSDDIAWCRDNIVFPGEKTYYEDGTDPVWEKLRLMYSCKHFIISNSTFSWWAQYLSRNKEKVVIAPKIWSNYGYDRDIFDQKWVIIDNGDKTKGNA